MAASGSWPEAIGGGAIPLRNNAWTSSGGAKDVSQREEGSRGSPHFVTCFGSVIRHNLSSLDQRVNTFAERLPSY